MLVEGYLGVCGKREIVKEPTRPWNPHFGGFSPEFITRSRKPSDLRKVITEASQTRYTHSRWFATRLARNAFRNVSDTVVL